jgi:hypothetical protein
MKPYTVVLMRSERLDGDIYVDTQTLAETPHDAGEIARITVRRVDRVDFRKEFRKEKPTLADYHVLVVFDGWHMPHVGHPRPKAHKKKKEEL